MSSTTLETPQSRIPPGLVDSTLIDIKTVRQMVGFRTSTPIYDRLREGKFPQPVRLSSRCTRWRVRDVVSWIESQGAAA